MSGAPVGERAFSIKVVITIPSVFVRASLAIAIALHISLSSGSHIGCFHFFLEICHNQKFKFKAAGEKFVPAISFCACYRMDYIVRLLQGKMSQPVYFFYVFT
jgi:hypothetical protein